MHTLLASISKSTYTNYNGNQFIQQKSLFPPMQSTIYKIMDSTEYLLLDFNQMGHRFLTTVIKMPRKLFI